MKILIIRPDDEEAIVQLLGRLRDKAGLLDSIGALMVRSSQEAFIKQRFGSYLWPERYEGGPEPFVNVAGIVADFNAGRNPPSRRFDRRPALMDTGELARSPSWRRVGPDAVEAGSTVPYAGLHQHGGESTQPVTSETKSRLWKWLKGRRTSARRKPAGTQRETATKQAKGLHARLGFLMNKNTTELVTKVHRRPFVGITDRDETEIRELVEGHVAGE